MLKNLPFLPNVSERVVPVSWTSYLNWWYVRLISLNSVTERSLTSAVAVCSPTEDHRMDLTGFQLDTKVILGLLWCLAVFSGKCSETHGSAWLVASV